MTAYKLKLRPGGIIPPAVEVGVELKRRAVAELPPVVLAGSPPATLPTGVDRWYDSRNAIIPWRAYDAVTLPDVNNWENGVGFGDAFSLDDDADYELDIPDLYTASNPDRSAWWMLQVPADAPAGCLLTVDNFQSVPGPASTLDPGDPYVPDLFLNLITTDVDPIPAGVWPDTLDFTNLYQVAYDEDTPDPDTGKQYCSKIADFELVPGKTYWIRCDLYDAVNGVDDDVIYRLRLSIVFP